eukprot:g5648.t1
MSEQLSSVVAGAYGRRLQQYPPKYQVLAKRTIDDLETHLRDQAPFPNVNAEDAVVHLGVRSDALRQVFDAWIGLSSRYFRDDDQVAHASVAGSGSAFHLKKGGGGGPRRSGGKTKGKKDSKKKPVKKQAAPQMKKSAMKSQEAKGRKSSLMKKGTSMKKSSCGGIKPQRARKTAKTSVIFDTRDSLNSNENDVIPDIPVSKENRRSREEVSPTGQIRHWCLECGQHFRSKNTLRRHDCFSVHASTKGLIERARAGGLLPKPSGIETYAQAMIVDGAADDLHQTSGGKIPDIAARGAAMKAADSAKALVPKLSGLADLNSSEDDDYQNASGPSYKSFGSPSGGLNLKSFPGAASGASYFSAAPNKNTNKGGTTSSSGAVPSRGKGMSDVTYNGANREKERWTINLYSPDQMKTKKLDAHVPFFQPNSLDAHAYVPGSSPRDHQHGVPASASSQSTFVWGTVMKRPAGGASIGGAANVLPAVAKMTNSVMLNKMKGNKADEESDAPYDGPTTVEEFVQQVLSPKERKELDAAKNQKKRRKKVSSGSKKLETIPVSELADLSVHYNTSEEKLFYMFSELLVQPVRELHYCALFCLTKEFSHKWTTFSLRLLEELFLSQTLHTQQQQQSLLSSNKQFLKRLCSFEDWETVSFVKEDLCYVGLRLANKGSVNLSTLAFLAQYLVAPAMMRWEAQQLALYEQDLVEHRVMLRQRLSEVKLRLKRERSAASREDASYADDVEDDHDELQPNDAYATPRKRQRTTDTSPAQSGYGGSSPQSQLRMNMSKDKLTSANASGSPGPSRSGTIMSSKMVGATSSGQINVPGSPRSLHNQVSPLSPRVMGALSPRVLQESLRPKVMTTKNSPVIQLTKRTTRSPLGRQMFDVEDQSWQLPVEETEAPVQLSQSWLSQTALASARQRSPSPPRMFSPRVTSVRPTGPAAGGILFNALASRAPSSTSNSPPARPASPPARAHSAPTPPSLRPTVASPSPAPQAQQQSSVKDANHSERQYFEHLVTLSFSVKASVTATSTTSFCFLDKWIVSGPPALQALAILQIPFGGAGTSTSTSLLLTRAFAYARFLVHRYPELMFAERNEWRAEEYVNTVVSPTSGGMLKKETPRPRQNTPMQELRVLRGALSAAFSTLAQLQRPADEGRNSVDFGDEVRNFLEVENKDIFSAIEVQYEAGPMSPRASPKKSEAGGSGNKHSATMQDTLETYWKRARVSHIGLQAKKISFQ